MDYDKFKIESEPDTTTEFEVTARERTVEECFPSRVTVLDTVLNTFTHPSEVPNTAKSQPKQEKIKFLT